MSDYIRKEDALECVTYDEEYTTEQIKGLPPADVVPVVRCKDCRYRVDSDKCCHPDGLLRSEDNDFCSYGKRREE